MGLQDKWQEAIIACAMIGNDVPFLQSGLETVRKWAEGHWTDGDIVDARIEFT